MPKFKVLVYCMATTGVNYEVEVDAADAKIAEVEAAYRVQKGKALPAPTGDYAVEPDYGSAQVLSVELAEPEDYPEGEGFDGPLDALHTATMRAQEHGGTWVVWEWAYNGRWYAHRVLRKGERPEEPGWEALWELTEAAN